MDPLDVSPSAIRSLRGSLSRAAFARQVGVTPLTVYRWELPEERPDARRPRGASLTKLAELARHGAGAAPSGEPDELAVFWPHVERALAGDLRGVRAELVDRLARRPPTTPDGRALAGVALALADVLLRYDGRAAIAVLAGAIADAEAGRLDRAVAGRVHATAALVHALHDGALFDLGKVHAHATRAEALARPLEDDDIVHLARLATVKAATAIADADLLARAFDRLGLDRSAPAGLRSLSEEYRGLELLFHGNPTAAIRVFEGVVARATDAPLSYVRAMGFLAICRLEALAPPDAVLADVTAARAIARRERMVHGPHDVFLLRAGAEALVRLGRLSDARAMLRELDAGDDESGFLSYVGIPTRVRIALLTGDTDDLRALHARLEAVTLPALQSVVLANLAYVEAMLVYLEAPPLEASQAFVRAAGIARRWVFLDREVTYTRVLAHVTAGETAAADAALVHLGRVAEIAMSAWLSAQTLRLEGLVHAARLDWARARPLLDAAAETMDRGGDRPAAALTRHVRATLAEAFDDPERAPGAVAASQRELAELGVRAPPSLAFGVALVKNRPERDRVAGLVGVEELLVPFQRLSVRGATVAFLERELVSVVEQIFRSPVRLEVLRAGEGEMASEAEATPASHLSASAVDLSDGAGRRLRLSVERLVTREDRALLAVIAMHAALAMERAAAQEEPADVPAEATEVKGFVAASPAMRRLRGELARLGASRATVIVTGESGTGKEVVARAIHALSARGNRPFVAFNCAAVPRDLFEGQLFGHRRGAFTGATEAQPGVVRSAAGGTLFLDEIGELPLELQPKLLRFLDRGEIFPLGEQKPHVVDVRVIAATHRDLAVLVRQGAFREDLYYRLQVVPLEVPPLRERPEDVVALARHFARELGEGAVLTPDALAKLSRHTWPGNVRELRNVIERALAFSPRPPALRAEHLVLRPA